jgi:hypothetical protein
MAGLFNIFSSTCLERITRSLKGVFHFFYSFLIMAPVKNRWKKKHRNKILLKQGDILEFPVGSVVWARLASSPWWPGIYKCVWVNFYVIRTVYFLTFHILTNKMHKLQYNKTDHKTLCILSINCYMFHHQET